MSDQVSAKVITHSKSKETGKEVITFELEFPRIVLAEFNTHNALSKNTSSSRAIPVATMSAQVAENPSMPVRFGKKNPGMQDAGEHDQQVFIGHVGGYYEGYYTPQEAWKIAAEVGAGFANAFDYAGYAKQVCNRLSEIGQRVKVVMTATQLENFYWLRDHKMADPTIEALAKDIKRAHKESIPVELDVGDWHVPYFGGEGVGYWLKGCGIELQEALDISASCAAQASYRKLDDSLEKAKSVVDRLNLGIDITEPMHVSPTEHQCTPIEKAGDYWDEGGNYLINHPFDPNSWQEGVTHVKKNGTLCSGNLEGWVQYRKLIKGNCYGEE